MISSMSPFSPSSSATARVEKATSEFLIGPDWTMNIDICDTINSNQMLAKDVVKAVKKRLQHKNPKVQLLALTLLETMVKNCGDFLHFQIAERDVLQEMVKIVKKKTDMNVRNKILTLIGSWYEAFGGPGGKHPQYYIAYEDLRRYGVEFPRRSPDAAPIFTPPVTHPASGHPQPGYGMPSSSSVRLDEAMASEEKLSLSSINSMRDVLDLLADMLQAIDPKDPSAVKDEVIVDLVERCRANQRKLMQMLTTTTDEELLGQGLEINDSLQTVIGKHNAIASGSPLPPEVTNVKIEASERNDSRLKSTETSMSNTTSNNNSSVTVCPATSALADEEEEEEEEDDFAQLARRHSKTRTNISRSTSVLESHEAPSSPAMSNALVPIDPPAPVQTKDQVIIDLLSLTLSTATSTEQTSATTTPPSHSMPQGHMPSATPGVPFSSEAYPGNPGLAFNSYVAPWAQPQPQTQPEIQHQSEAQSPRMQQPLHQSQHQYATPPVLQPPRLQPPSPRYTAQYPPPPWAATPGYLSNQSSVTRTPYLYSTYSHISSPKPRPMQSNSSNGETQFSAGQKPFIPSYRLFEDLDVFGNADGRLKGTSSGPPSLSGSNNKSMVGGRK